MDKLDPRAHEAGMTLVEAAVTTVLTAVVLGAIYGSLTTVNRVSTDNNREVMLRARQMKVLTRIQSELEHSGKSGRYSVDFGGGGITYAKLVGAEQVGGDVSGVWSDEWRIERTPEGLVKRSKDSWTETIATGIDALQFTRNPDD